MALDITIGADFDLDLAALTDGYHWEQSEGHIGNYETLRLSIVADAAAALALFGLGLAGLGFARRRLR